MGRTTCNEFCVTGKCKRRKACACDCGALSSINPNLVNACIDQCNSANRPKNHQDFLCNFNDPNMLLELYEIPVCGLSVEDTTGYQELQDEKEAQAAQAANEQKYVAGAFVIVLLLLIIFWKS